MNLEVLFNKFAPAQAEAQAQAQTASSFFFSIECKVKVFWKRLLRRFIGKLLKEKHLESDVKTARSK